MNLWTNGAAARENLYGLLQQEETRLTAHCEKLDEEYRRLTGRLTGIERNLSDVRSELRQLREYMACLGSGLTPPKCDPPQEVPL